MKRAGYTLIGLVFVSGCASNYAAVTEGQSQLALRQVQTRTYEVDDSHRALRSVIATLQDLEFVIDKADSELATVTATRLQGQQVRMTVTVRERESQRFAVRANIRIDERAVDDPGPYQDFFAALDKSLFLSRHRVD